MPVTRLIAELNSVPSKRGYGDDDVSALSRIPRGER